MSQKDIFLQSEGDAWFMRNRRSVAARRLPDDDPLLREILNLMPENFSMQVGPAILEVGCGDGTRLAWLKNNLNAVCHGIEPSPLAVAAARAKGIEVVQGTADKFPFDSQSFDILLFGFCLYLCDPEDLFRIASEADRVLRAPGWLLILDFHSATPKYNPYRHCTGVISTKMDYKTMFSWHPYYECITHLVRDHTTGRHTDIQDECVSVSVLRKYRRGLSP